LKTARRNSFRSAELAALRAKAAAADFRIDALWDALRADAGLASKVSQQRDCNCRFGP
jgi:hypothetical protein